MEVTEAPRSMIWQTRLPASWLVLYAQYSYVGQLKDDSERTHLCTRPPTKNVTFQHSEGYKSHLETTKACCPCTVFIFISCVLCVCMHKQHDQSTSEQLPLGRNQPPLGHRWYTWLSSHKEFSPWNEMTWNSRAPSKNKKGNSRKRTVWVFGGKCGQNILPICHNETHYFMQSISTSLDKKVDLVLFFQP